MINVLKTDEFADWLDALTDRKAAARITARIRRLELGNPGKTRALGGGLIEMKEDYGPGYRVYYIEHGKTVVVLLCGGDKSSQSRDIKAARMLAEQARGML